jgi:predicted RNase H-like HicB family nuclease
MNLTLHAADGRCRHAACRARGAAELHVMCVENNKQPFGGNMENKYTAVIKEDDGWWIGWVEEIPGVNCQEKTKEELIETLRVTLKEALEMNKNKALAIAESDYSEVVLEL